MKCLHDKIKAVERGERSRQYQNEVGERLSEQVLHGLYELVRGFHAADQQVQGQLLGFTRDDERNTAYRAFLNVMLRLVFLLYAEARDLLSEDETFVRYYSLGGLYERLRADQGLHPDTMDARYGAWSQLLNLFRMVYEGARTDDLQLTARYGDLFDPSRFPFLEGWRRTEAPQVTQAAVPPLVPDGTVYRILDKLMVLDGERISYRALDVEQIGSVYETMMGFRIERSTGRSVAIKAQLRGGAPTTIDLDALLGVPPGQRAKWVEKRTGRKLTKTVTVPLRGAHTLESVHAALGRVVDRDATPDLVPPGSPVLQPSDERRASGSFYTPRTLTSPIVEAALEPVLENLGEGGVPEPAALLDLKVCDLAMGSAAFLVEACRQLGDHLVEAWRAHGGVPDMLPTEDEVVVARRLIAERCLYGVDRNPMAAALAKVSLWLVTLSRDRPLTFVDHALRSGDSLLGLSQEQIGAFTWKKGPLPAQLELQTEVRDAVEAGSWLRREIAEASPDTSPPDRADWLRDVDEQLLAVRLYGDVVLEAFFSSPKAKKRKANRYKAFTQIAGGGGDRFRRLADQIESLRQEEPPFAPFHWEIEFPEVFDRANPGFDVIIGNPPFAGKNTLAHSNVPRYPLWLKYSWEGGGANTDLVAYFYRRAFDLLRESGTFGLVATNTIAQGDTRGLGLRWICTHGGEVYRVITRIKWGEGAAVVVSVVHAARGQYNGQRLIDGRAVDKITAFLFHRGGHDDPCRLPENAARSFQGNILRGMGFTFDDMDNKGVSAPLSTTMHTLIGRDERNQEAIHPYIGGAELNSSPQQSHHRYAISFRDWPLRRVPHHEWQSAARHQRDQWLREGLAPPGHRGPVAEDWPDLVAVLKEVVRPGRLALPSTAGNATAIKYWWRYAAWRVGLHKAIAGLDRVLAISRVGQHCAFAFLPAGMVYADSLVIFPFDSYAAFCGLQARPHEIWARFFGSSLEERLRYTPSDVFETFPFPAGWTCHPALEAAGRAYYEYRADLMIRSDEGLTKTYNRFHNPEEQHPDIVRLRELHGNMDRAVLGAYGWTDIDPVPEFLLDYEIDEATWGRKKKPYRYRWPDPVQDEVLARLLELNGRRAEAQGVK